MNVGDRLRCRKCGHERQVNFDWLRQVCRGRPGRSAEQVRASLEKQLPKFKCEGCGARAVQHLAADMRMPRRKLAVDPTKVDEGIAGSREDNKRMRARQWGEIVNRGKSRSPRS